MFGFHHRSSAATGITTYLSRCAAVSIGTIRDIWIGTTPHRKSGWATPGLRSGETIIATKWKSPSAATIPTGCRSWATNAGSVLADCTGHPLRAIVPTRAAILHVRFCVGANSVTTFLGKTIRAARAAILRVCHQIPAEPGAALLTRRADVTTRTAIVPVFLQVPADTIRAARQWRFAHALVFLLCIAVLTFLSAGTLSGAITAFQTGIDLRAGPVATQLVNTARIVAEAAIRLGAELCADTIATVLTLVTHVSTSAAVRIAGRQVPAGAVAVGPRRRALADAGRRVANSRGRARCRRARADAGGIVVLPGRRTWDRRTTGGRILAFAVARGTLEKPRGGIAPRMASPLARNLQRPTAPRRVSKGTTRELIFLTDLAA